MRINLRLVLLKLMVVAHLCMTGPSRAAEPATGDQVIVRLDDAPLKAGNRVIQTISQDSQLHVEGEQGSWLLVSGGPIRRKGWIHRNHVALEDAPEVFGKEPIPLANLMKTPVLDPNNPWFLMHLPEQANELLASGQEMELIRIEQSMMQTLNRMQSGVQGTLISIDVVGVLSDAYRMAGERKKAIFYVDQHYNRIKQVQRRLNHADLSILDRIGASGWADARYGNLARAAQKLEESTAGIDAIDNSSMLDGRIHTRYAYVLLQQGKPLSAASKLRTALLMDRAFRAEQDARGANASGTTGLTESLLALCEVHRADIQAAFKQMDAGQRQQHRYATWPSHLDNPYREFMVRENSDENIEDAFFHAISMAVQFPVLDQVPVSAMSAQ